MRYAVLAFLTLPLAAAYVHAQDLGAAAAQQAQQAMQQAQQASEQAQRDSQNAIANAASLPAVTRTPQFSVRPGTYGAAVTVRLHSPTSHARIFYTIDGWTPTTASLPYTAPLLLSASTRVQAIAIAPGYGASRIATGQYIMPSAAAAAPVQNPAAAPLTAPQALNAGTMVELRFPQEISSETAYVGQPLQLTLSQNLVVDGHLLAPSGTPASAVVTEADATRRAYQAGVISFALKSIAINGVQVPLAGTRTLEGTAVSVGRAALFLIPVAGPLTILKHGAPATIPVGAELQGTVAASAVIPPAPASP